MISTQRGTCTKNLCKKFSQCLSSVTTALGLGFKPFAEPVFQRCVKLVAKTLVETQMHQQNLALDMPDKDFMIVALDLLSGLTQGLNTSIESLVASSQPPLLPLLTACMTVRGGEGYKER